MPTSPSSTPPAENNAVPVPRSRLSLAKRLRSSAADLWLWMSVLALVIVLCISFVLTIQPLDRDEGAFAVIAHSITQGKLPYRDYFDQQGPGIYYVLTAILVLAHSATPMQ